MDEVDGCLSRLLLDDAGEGLRRGDPSYAGLSYLSRLSEKLREHGGIVSSAELIEAMPADAAVDLLNEFANRAFIPLRLCYGRSYF